MTQTDRLSKASGQPTANGTPLAQTRPATETKILIAENPQQFQMWLSRRATRRNRRVAWIAWYRGSASVRSARRLCRRAIEHRFDQARRNRGPPCHPVPDCAALHPAYAFDGPGISISKAILRIAGKPYPGWQYSANSCTLASFNLTEVKSLALSG